MECKRHDRSQLPDDGYHACPWASMFVAMVFHMPTRVWAWHRYFYMFCHPEAKPKDLNVKDTPARSIEILRYAQNDIL